MVEKLPEIPFEQPTPTYTQEVGGSFECTVCYEYVWVAQHSPTAKTLSWTCENGHTTTIEVNWNG